MSSRQKIKGTRVEHEAAEFLTEIFGVKFSRVLGSGMFGGFKDDLKGDVRVDTLPGAEYSKSFPIVEVKSLKTLSIENVLRVDTVVQGYLSQAFAAGKDQSLLICKLDRAGWIICLHPDNSSEIRENFLRSTRNKVYFKVENTHRLPPEWPSADGWVFFTSLKDGNAKERAKKKAARKVSKSATKR